MTWLPPAPRLSQSRARISSESNEFPAGGWRVTPPSPPPARGPKLRPNFGELPTAWPSRLARDARHKPARHAPPGPRHLPMRRRAPHAAAPGIAAAALARPPGSPGPLGAGAPERGAGAEPDGTPARRPVGPLPLSTQGGTTSGTPCNASDHRPASPCPRATREPAPQRDPGGSRFRRHRPAPYLPVWLTRSPEGGSRKTRR